VLFTEGLPAPHAAPARRGGTRAPSAGGADQPPAQRDGSLLRPFLVAEGVDDAARRPIDADRGLLIQPQPVVVNLEAGGSEHMPGDRGFGTRRRRLRGSAMSMEDGPAVRSGVPERATCTFAGPLTSPLPARSSRSTIRATGLAHHADDRSHLQPPAPGEPPVRGVCCRPWVRVANSLSCPAFQATRLAPSDFVLTDNQRASLASAQAPSVDPFQTFLAAAVQLQDPSGRDGSNWPLFLEHLSISRVALHKVCRQGDDGRSCDDRC